MFKSVVLYVLGALALLGSPVAAAGNCDSYTVIPGDTLRLIAERYYGDRALSPIIYDANTEVVGEDPNTIEIGMQLEIPCREGMQVPPETAFLALVVPDAAAESTTALPLQLIAKAANTPFVGRDNSGIIPDILRAALREGGYGGPAEMRRPETGAEVLQISTGPGPALSFPWIMPDCADPSSLSARSRNLCDNYTFSDPLFEITLGLFTRADSPLAAADTAAAFAGATLCAPQFHTDDALRQSGIVAAGADVVLSPDFKACLSGLEAGTFDAVLADYQSYKTFVAEGRGLVDIPAFAYPSTLHAVAYSQDPASMEILATTNLGLQKILSSGEWFAIVSDNLERLNN